MLGGLPSRLSYTILLFLKANLQITLGEGKYMNRRLPKNGPKLSLVLIETNLQIMLGGGE